jgi:hypothetical protein
MKIEILSHSFYNNGFPYFAVQTGYFYIINFQFYYLQGFCGIQGFSSNCKQECIENSGQIYCVLYLLITLIVT